ncbi:hypothetical protein ACA910_004094 [Epithemia clementina (nom. ined.)]
MCLPVVQNKRHEKGSTDLNFLQEDLEDLDNDIDDFPEGTTKSVICSRIDSTWAGYMFEMCLPVVQNKRNAAVTFL